MHGFLKFTDTNIALFVCYKGFYCIKYIMKLNNIVLILLPSAGKRLYYKFRELMPEKRTDCLYVLLRYSKINSLF